MRLVFDAEDAEDAEEGDFAEAKKRRIKGIEFGFFSFVKVVF